MLYYFKLYVYCRYNGQSILLNSINLFMFLLMFSTVQILCLLLYPKTIILCCAILGSHVRIRIMVLWNMVPCSLKSRYQSFGGICNFCLQGKRETSVFSKTWAPLHSTVQHHVPKDCNLDFMLYFKLFSSIIQLTLLGLHYFLIIKYRPYQIIFNNYFIVVTHALHF